jgi:hypothetical protein
VFEAKQTISHPYETKQELSDMILDEFFTTKHTHTGIKNVLKKVFMKEVTAEE